MFELKAQMEQKKRLTVVKVGGAVVEDADALAEFLKGFAAIEGDKILVHGGGRSATALAKQLGLTVTMIDGRRVTDADMLRVVTMVYGGLVNKNIVASLESCGVKSLGITGADMSVIKSNKRNPHPIDYGYVGDVKEVDAKALSLLIGGGYVPVVAPLTLGDGGELLNTNADTVAAAVASAMSALYDVTLAYCFELPGVMVDPEDETSVIKKITPAEYTKLKEEGIVSGGMIPKLDNAFKSLNDGVSCVKITSWKKVGDPESGTHIKPLD